jgi:hypothetical protein
MNEYRLQTFSTPVHILKFPISNPSPETGSIYAEFSCFSSAPPSGTGIVFYIRPRLFSFQTFLIHNSLMILSFHGAEQHPLTASFNTPQRDKRMGIKLPYMIRIYQVLGSVTG